MSKKKRGTKKKRVNTRRVGNRNERETIKALQGWTGWEFHKVPASGGLHWGEGRVSGDVIPEEKHFDDVPFSIEAKRMTLESFRIQDFVYPGKKTLIVEHWEQAKRDAKEVNKEPILFVRVRGTMKGFFFVFMYSHTFFALNNKYPIEDYVEFKKEGLVMFPFSEMKRHRHTKVFKRVKKIRRNRAEK